MVMAAKARGQILIVFAAIPLLILMISMVSVYAYREESRSGRLIRDADRSQALLRLEIEEASNSLHALIDSLQEGNSGLVSALETGNEKALEANVAPYFAHLRDQHGISHLYFSRPDRTPLLRLDGSGKSGQVVDRITLFDTAEQAGRSDGLDLNAFGVVTLRVTVGWRDASGKLIGFVEVGRDIAPMIDAIHRVMGLDILLLVRKDMLDRDRWEEGERQTGGQGSWDELANYVSVATTLATIPTPIGLMLEDGKPAMNGDVTIVGVGRRNLAMSVRPLLDLEQKPIGDIVLIRDVTENTKSMGRTLLWLMSVGVVLIALGFWRSRWLLREEEAETPPAE
jgi:hypothetical protein